MKAVISGLICNTETATCICKHDNGYYRGDWGWLEEGLFRTCRGAWFLAGEGGPASKYATRNGNLTSSGAAILPLCEQEALAWLEAHGTVGDIEKYFGDSIKEA